ncbi:MAG: radical SAM protein [Candidatus Riflebacteria bacterium]|nr:radical SAM protein [Candidatus Riflebacteria bacterium]
MWTIESLRETISSRKVYIYGVNLEGNGICRLFSYHNFSVAGFVDSRRFDGDKKLGKPIIHPDTFFSSADPKNDFLIIGTKHRETKALAIGKCTSHLFQRDKDFIISTELCEYLPTIEISGICNLRCISCNLGVEGAQHGGFMESGVYLKVLEKMIKEIPLMNSVCLYLWGEPLLHPELSEIVKVTSAHGIACDISTNLNPGRYLEKLIEARPDMITVPCSGIGQNYEMTHTKGKWETFKENLNRLRFYIDKFNSDTAVRIIYHLYKHNLEEDYDRMESIAKELGFFFFPLVANIFPEKVFNYVVKKEAIPEGMRQINERLIFPVEEQLAYSIENKHRFCPNMKAFPTVRWDKSVILCCNREGPKLSEDYLETSLASMAQQRKNHETCAVCKSHGIHRFFDVNGKVSVVDGKRIVTR